MLLSDGNQYKAHDPGLAIGFWHSGAVGDLNNDGLADLLAVTTSKGSNTIAIQQKNGTFKKTSLSLGFSSNDKRVVAGEIIDVDQDGNRDIVVSSAFGSKLTILWGDGTGEFSKKSSVDVPGPFNHVVDINIGDFDGNGGTELVLLSTQGEDQGKSNFYKGYAVMLVGVSKRQIDKPTTIESNKNAKWFPWIYSCDLNGDLKDEVFSFVGQRGLDGKKTGKPAFYYSAPR